MYDLFSSWCPLYFKCCNEFMFAPSLLPLVCCSHGCLLSSSSKENPLLLSSEGKLEPQVKYLLRPLTLLTAMEEWWKSLCIPRRSNVTADNLSKQDAGICFFTKWWSGWLTQKQYSYGDTLEPANTKEEGRSSWKEGATWSGKLPSKAAYMNP